MRNNATILFTNGHALSFSFAPNGNVIVLRASRGIHPYSEDIGAMPVDLAIGDLQDSPERVREVFMGLASEKVVPCFKATEGVPGELRLQPINGDSFLGFAYGEDFDGVRLIRADETEILKIPVEDFAAEPGHYANVLFGLLAVEAGLIR